MIYSKEVQEMCVVAKGPKHGPAPIPEEGKWVKATGYRLVCSATRLLQAESECKRRCDRGGTR